jgi:hypothetical protein
MANRGLVQIYNNLIKIQAKKGGRSLWPGERFQHKFRPGSKAEILGVEKGGTYQLRAGDLVTRSQVGKPLWDYTYYNQREGGMVKEGYEPFLENPRRRRRGRKRRVGRPRKVGRRRRRRVGRPRGRRRRRRMTAKQLMYFGPKRYRKHRRRRRRSYGRRRSRRYSMSALYRKLCGVGGKRRRRRRGRGRGRKRHVFGGRRSRYFKSFSFNPGEELMFGNRRRRRRRYRRNPAASYAKVGGFDWIGNLDEAAILGSAFLGADFIPNWIHTNGYFLIDSPWKWYVAKFGVGLVGVLGFNAMKKGKMGKLWAYGVLASMVKDLLVQYVVPLITPTAAVPVPATGTSGYPAAMYRGGMGAGRRPMRGMRGVGGRGMGYHPGVQAQQINASMSSGYDPYS